LLLLGALVGLSSIDDFGRKHEWWGVPVRLVMVDGVNFVEPDSRNYEKEGLPYITGTIYNF
jgi:hypothetical protein